MTDWLDRIERLRGIIEAHADEAEAARRLPAAVAQSMARAGLYRIAAPARFHGADADPVAQIETIEAVSRIDGSTGWNLMIGVETFGLVAPGLDGCAELIADPETVMCSSTAAVGRAERCSGGWRVEGQWPFVSGCHNSTVFGATVRLFENGEPLPDRGQVYAMVRAPDFAIVDTWHVNGLRGSGSHDVRVDDVTVPDEYIVAPIGGHSDHRSPLARIPIGTRLAYNKVAVALGIGRAGVDAFASLAAAKTPGFSSRLLRDRPAAQRARALADVRLRSLRAGVVDLTRALWDTVLAEQPVEREFRAIFQIACSDAVAQCVELVDLLCESAGTTANRIGEPLERIARDIRVIRQHATVSPHHIVDGGRVLLGLDPQEMMLRLP